MLRIDEVWVEVLEWSKDDTRSASRRAIDKVITEIGRAIAMPKDKIDSGEFWRIALPDGTIAESESLVVQKRRHGEYSIHGFINGGEPGVVTVRAFDPDSGAELQREKASLRRSEYVGWCRDKDVYFPFESSYFPTDSSKDKSVRFEAWFYPLPGQGKKGPECQAVLDSTVDPKF